MATFALIKPNKCTFDDLDKCVTPLLYIEDTNHDRKTLKKSLNEYIWSQIEPFIEFVNVQGDPEDMLTCLCTRLIEQFPNNKPDDFYYHTEASYSFPKKYLEQVHYHIVDSKKDDKTDDKTDLNYLGCLFNLKHHAIEHTCAIIANKYDFTSDCFVRVDSVTKEDILRVIRRRYFFSAVLIKENAFAKYYYQNLSHLITQVFGLDSTSSITKISFTLFRYNIVFYFKPNNTSAYVNQAATRMAGSHIIHGDVLMIHELDTHVYGNLSIREAKRLNVLSYGRLYDRDLKEDEIKPMERFAEDIKEVNNESNQTGTEPSVQTKKVIPIWSRYLVVERRMAKWQENKNRCIHCGLENNKLYACNKCYRVKYCSKRCEEDFRAYHSSECF